MNTEEALKRPIHFSPRRLAHANLFVRALEDSLAFFNRTCGLEIVMRQPAIGGGFLSNGNTHHDIGLIQATDRSVFGEGGHRILAEGQGSRPGLNHLGWEMESEFELTKAYQRAEAAEFKIHRTVQHRSSRSVYVFDPDGSVHEFYADTDRDWRGRYKDGTTVSGQWTPDAGMASMEARYHDDPAIVRNTEAPIHPVRITHAVLSVRNFERMRSFFVNVAGLQEVFASDARGVAAFQAPKTRGPYAVAIVKEDRLPDVGRRKLHHITFEVPDEGDIEIGERRFSEMGVKIERRIEVAHKRSVFVQDPDGTFVEFQYQRSAPLPFEQLVESPDIGFLI
jgi:catechol 2,3-dioxygenase